MANMNQVMKKNVKSTSGIPRSGEKKNIIGPKHVPLLGVKINNNINLKLTLSRQQHILKVMRKLIHLLSELHHRLELGGIESVEEQGRNQLELFPQGLVFLVSVLQDPEVLKDLEVGMEILQQYHKGLVNGVNGFLADNFGPRTRVTSWYTSEIFFLFGVMTSITSQPCAAGK